MERTAIELAKRSYRVDVVTYHEALVGSEQREEGFQVHRVANPVRSHVNIVTWALTLNTELQRVAANIILESPEDSKLIHAAEWLCVPAAIQLKKTLRVPFTLSLYSIEQERSAGGTLAASIGYLEKAGCAEAQAVMVNRKSTADLLQKLYNISVSQMTVLESKNSTLGDALLRYADELATIENRRAQEIR